MRCPGNGVILLYEEIMKRNFIFVASDCCLYVWTILIYMHGCSTKQLHMLGKKNASFEIMRRFFSQFDLGFSSNPMVADDSDSSTILILQWFNSRVFFNHFHMASRERLVEKRSQISNPRKNEIGRYHFSKLSYGSWEINFTLNPCMS